MTETPIATMSEAMTGEALFELLTLECRAHAHGAMSYHNSDGRLHRSYGPAVIHGNGRHEWYQNGRQHRLDGPAIVCPTGYRAWYQDGQLHRLDGPAIEYSDGGCEWYQNGQLHRIDGPAFEDADVCYGWYINGRALTEAEWQQAVASMAHV